MVIVRRRELGISHEHISKKQICVRALLSCTGVALLTVLVLGIIIFLKVFKAQSI